MVSVRQVGADRLGNKKGPNSAGPHIASGT